MGLISRAVRALESIADSYESLAHTQERARLDAIETNLVARDQGERATRATEEVSDSQLRVAHAQEALAESNARAADAQADYYRHLVASSGEKEQQS